MKNLKYYLSILFTACVAFACYAQADTTEVNAVATATEAQQKVSAETGQNFEVTQKLNIDSNRLELTIRNQDAVDCIFYLENTTQNTLDSVEVQANAEDSKHFLLSDTKYVGSYMKIYKKGASNEAIYCIIPKVDKMESKDNSIVFYIIIGVLALFLLGTLGYAFRDKLSKTREEEEERKKEAKNAAIQLTEAVVQTCKKSKKKLGNETKANIEKLSEKIKLFDEKTETTTFDEVLSNLKQQVETIADENVTTRWNELKTAIENLFEPIPSDSVVVILKKDPQVPTCIADTRQQIATLNNQLNPIREKLKSLNIFKTYLTEYAKNFIAHEEDKEKQKAALNLESDLGKDIDQLHAFLDGLAEQSNCIEKSVSDVEAYLKEIITELKERPVTDGKKSDGEIKKLKTKVGTLEQEKKNLEQENNTLEQENNTLEQEKKTLKGENKTLESKLQNETNKKNIALDDAARNKEKAKQAISEYNKLQQELNQKVKNAQDAERVKHEGTISNLKTQLNDTQEKLSQTTTDLKKTTNTLTATQQERDKYIDKTKRLEESVQIYNQKLTYVPFAKDYISQIYQLVNLADSIESDSYKLLIAANEIGVDPYFIQKGIAKYAASRGEVDFGKFLSEIDMITKSGLVLKENAIASYNQEGDKSVLQQELISYYFSTYLQKYINAIVVLNEAMAGLEILQPEFAREARKFADRRRLLEAQFNALNITVDTVHVGESIQDNVDLKVQLVDAGVGFTGQILELENCIVYLTGSRRPQQEIRVKAQS